MCCERCHCNAAPPTTPEALAYRPPKPPPRLKPTARAQLIRRWRAFLETTGLPVFNIADGPPWCRLAGWCPVCRLGIVIVDFPDTTPPVARLDGCDAGCTFDQLVEAAHA